MSRRRPTKNNASTPTTRNQEEATNARIQPKRTHTAENTETAHTETPPANDPDRTTRQQALLDFTPRATPYDVVRVQAQVIEAVLRLPYKSPSSDRSRLTIVYGFAIWSLHNGSFDYKTDLNESDISLYVDTQLGHMSQGTRNTYKSTLNRVRKGSNIEAKGRRVESQTAYTEAEWNIYWNAVSNAGRFSLDGLTLLALTGGAGLTASETALAHAGWVVREPNGTHLNVPNKDGEFRQVPVTGPAEEVINRAVSRAPHSHLVMPTNEARRNISNKVKANITPEQAQFADFNVVRARHTWLQRLLEADVAYVTVAALAGIGTGIALPSTLAAELPTPDLNRLRTAINTCFG